MNQRSRLVILLFVVLPVLLSGCAERFEVLVVNHRDIPIKVVIGQFHAPDFKATAPATFTEKELIKQDLLELTPNERRTIVYNSAAGGFWLLWRMLEPLPEPNRVVTLDLLRDSRVINIQ